MGLFLSLKKICRCLLGCLSSLLSKRSSTPGIGWTESLPFLMRETCKSPSLKSTCSHLRLTASETLRPCRNIIVTNVSSLRAFLECLRIAWIKLSISSWVKYSLSRCCLLVLILGAFLDFVIFHVLVIVDRIQPHHKGYWLNLT